MKGEVKNAFQCAMKMKHSKTIGLCRHAATVHLHLEGEGEGVSSVEKLNQSFLRRVANGA